MNNWSLLITSLPTENATVRMRVWRSLKASGAAVLRDGVYLMPERTPCHETFDSIAVEVRESGGTAWVLRIEEPDGGNFASLFERSEEFAALLADIAKLRNKLSANTAPDTLKQARKLRKAFTNLSAIDFFQAKRNGRPKQPSANSNCRLFEFCLPMNHTQFKAQSHLYQSANTKVVPGLHAADHGWIGLPVPG